MTEAPYRERLREATLADWRFLLGVAPGDTVLAAGAGGPRLAQSLSPWVRRVYRAEQRHQSADAFDWVFFGGTITLDDAGDDDAAGQARAAFAALRPGGHLAITLENRWGLHWLADWRVTDEAPPQRNHPRARRTHGLRWHIELLRRAGADDVRSYALLPSRDAPRAIIPVEPPCPPAAQRMALDQVWQRPSPSAALARRALGGLVNIGLMRWLYPHYLVVGRKPC